MGGGLLRELATFRRLFGVVGGGGIGGTEPLAASFDGASYDMAVVATSAVALALRSRFFAGAATSAVCPPGTLAAIA